MDAFKYARLMQPGNLLFAGNLFQLDRKGSVFVRGPLNATGI